MYIVCYVNSSVYRLLAASEYSRNFRRGGKFDDDSNSAIKISSKVRIRSHREAGELSRSPETMKVNFDKFQTLRESRRSVPNLLREKLKSARDLACLLAVCDAILFRSLFSQFNERDAMFAMRKRQNFAAATLSERFISLGIYIVPCFP